MDLATFMKRDITFLLKLMGVLDSATHLASSAHNAPISLPPLACGRGLGLFDHLLRTPAGLSRWVGL
jgi:hypothetical protein